MLIDTNIPVINNNEQLHAPKIMEVKFGSKFQILIFKPVPYRLEDLVLIEKEVMDLGCTTMYNSSNLLVVKDPKEVTFLNREGYCGWQENKIALWAEEICSRHGYICVMEWVG